MKLRPIDHVGAGVALFILAILIVLAVKASGAPPLQSPRAASAPKSTPMVRVVKPVFSPASVPFTEPAPQMTVGITNRINFTGCNTNDLNCVLWFGQYVSVVHPAGHELTIEFADIVNASEGALAARFGAGPVDRISEFTWFQPEDQRPPQRFFRSRTVIPILPASATIPVNIVSPALVNATATSRKR